MRDPTVIHCHGPRLTRAACLLGCVAALAGCASQPIAAPATIAVVELAPVISDDALRAVLHDKREPVDEATLAADRTRIADALDAAVRDASCARGTPAATGAAIRVSTPPSSSLGQALDSTELAELAAIAPADAFLRLRVTDYGATPRRWRTAYVTFEVVSTLAITAALAIKRATRPLAAAYLIEESVEELSEGFAGFWTLNRLSRPVRIEADLIEARSGRVLWHGARTGLARWRWRNLRHMDAARRDQLLASSTCKAVAAILGKLEPATR